MVEHTKEVSDTFITAYNHFNTALFNGQLVPCIIHMHRKSKCYGYFAGARFGNKDASVMVDEIALNPSTFATRSIEEILSTLVHEMVHLWQHHHGVKKSKSAYHNTEWADKMESIGLMPSDTAKPDGKRTGQKVSHYIMQGHAYALSVAVLLDTGFTLPYIELWDTAKKNSKAKADSKTKYSCPSCGLNAWAKLGVSLLCVDCGIHLEVA